MYQEIIRQLAEGQHNGDLNDQNLKDGIAIGITNGIGKSSAVEQSRRYAILLKDIKGEVDSFIEKCTGRIDDSVAEAGMNLVYEILLCLKIDNARSILQDISSQVAEPPLDNDYADIKREQADIFKVCATICQRIRVQNDDCVIRDFDEIEAMACDLGSTIVRANKSEEIREGLEEVIDGYFGEE